MEPTWLDRAIGAISPGWQFRRMQARARIDFLARHYDGAELSRRTQGWKRVGGDANSPSGLSLSRLRDAARHLVRNNGHASSALQTISDDAVGSGIVPAAKHDGWKRWANSKDCDAEGQANFAGLQDQVMQTVAQSGECLVRRRWRRLSDGFALPMQLQVLEPDYLDSSQHRSLSNGGRIVRGVEFNAFGQRVAYHLFRDHPGSSTLSSTMMLGQSARVPASEICHIYRIDRPGQVRGASWYAPVLIRFHDYDEYVDATLMKAKVAACLALITYDRDGFPSTVGKQDEDNDDRDILSPGLIHHASAGGVEVVQPPSVRDFADYSSSTLREIATGLGVTHEDLTGDYTNMPFSAARMSRLRHWRRVSGWRWKMLEPQFLQPVWTWAMQAAAVAGLDVVENTMWTAPPLPMLDPDKEGLAHKRNIRAGITSLPEVLRERGYNVDDHLEEIAESNERLDELAIILDSDPRYMTEHGQRHSSSALASTALGKLLAEMPDEEAEEVFELVSARLAASGNGAGQEVHG